MSSKTHDVVYTERYTDRDGNEKKRYTNVGAAFTKNGNMSIKLESVPVNFSGWLSLYEPKDKQAASKPVQARQSPAPGDDLDDLPF